MRVAYCPRLDLYLVAWFLYTSLPYVIISSYVPVLLSTLDILHYDIVTSLHLYSYSYVLEHYTYIFFDIFPTSCLLCCFKDINDCVKFFSAHMCHY